MPLSLFDKTDPVEIRSDACPWERLMACRNPLLAEERARKSVVAPARVSESAQRKGMSKRNAEGLPTHSFNTLLSDLATVVRNTVAPRLPGAEPFEVLTRPTPLQRKAFELLGVGLKHSQQRHLQIRQVVLKTSKLDLKPSRTSG